MNAVVSQILTDNLSVQPMAHIAEISIAIVGPQVQIHVSWCIHGLAEVVHKMEAAVDVESATEAISPARIEEVLALKDTKEQINLDIRRSQMVFVVVVCWEQIRFNMPKRRDRPVKPNCIGLPY